MRGAKRRFLIDKNHYLKSQYLEANLRLLLLLHKIKHQGTVIRVQQNQSGGWALAHQALV